ncbi:hypothetical protein Fot_06478 [Forsythia ovata]|uniref:Uncharacterized protein n=1 Tax=Forsythia ovata TaxID=205694 RepID=A0ABD1WT81_9LAMI
MIECTVINEESCIKCLKKTTLHLMMIYDPLPSTKRLPKLKLLQCSLNLHDYEPAPQQRIGVVVITDLEDKTVLEPLNPSELDNAPEVEEISSGEEFSGGEDIFRDDD